MGVRVYFHVYFLVESFATVAADVRTIVGVSPHVSVQIRSSIESLLTYWAYVRLH